MEQPGLTSVELYGGDHDGRTIELNAEIDALMMSGSRYVKGNDGVFRYCSPPKASDEANDRITSRMIEIFGLDTLTDLLAVTAVRQVLNANPIYWRLLADRIDRMRETS